MQPTINGSSRASSDTRLPITPAVRAGQFIYVSGILPIENETIVGENIRSQTKHVLDKLSEVLRGAGTRLQNAAAVTVYLKRPEDFAAMNEVYGSYWSSDPPARTTVVADLMVPNALVEIAMVAIAEGAERHVVHPTGWVRSPSPYSYGIKSGDTLFLSGLVSRSGKDNTLVPGDITAQTRLVLDNAGEILEAAGMTHRDVVSSRVYLTDVSNFQGMNAAYRSYFALDPPARATVKTGLMSPEYLVEITMVAVSGTGRQAFTTPNPDGTPGRPNPNLSSAIRVGSRLFVAGMLGNVEGVKPEIETQTRETLERIGRTLRSAGFGWEDVVDAVVYLPNAQHFDAMNEAYRQVFAGLPGASEASRRGAFPARATVGAGLVNPDGLVEIMVTAVRSRGPSGPPRG